MLERSLLLPSSFWDLENIEFAYRISENVGSSELLQLSGDLYERLLGRAAASGLERGSSMRWRASSRNGLMSQMTIVWTESSSTWRIFWALVQRHESSMASVVSSMMAMMAMMAMMR